jgi:flagellar basal-body rod protein FlgC
MVDTLSIALTGLMAQGQRLAVAASNIANAATIGALPTTESPASTVYKPLTVSYTALMTGNEPGGVSTRVTEDPNGYTAVSDPGSIYANEDGLVAAPNIDLNQEMVNLLVAKTLYKTNVSVIKTEKEMMGDLLDIVG